MVSTRAACRLLNIELLSWEWGRATLCSHVASAANQLPPPPAHCPWSQLIQDAMQQQAEQRASIMVEMERYRKDLAREQQRNEQRAAVLQRLEGQAQYLGAQIEKIRSRQGQLQVSCGPGR